MQSSQSAQHAVQLDPNFSGDLYSVQHGKVVESFPSKGWYLGHDQSKDDHDGRDSGHEAQSAVTDWAILPSP